MPPKPIHTDVHARRRTILVVAAPLAFAALLMLHPNGGGSFYELAASDTTAWMTVHLGSAVLFPLMAWIVWLLIRDTHGAAASVARIALPVFAVAYGVWEALVGIASGILAQEGNAASGEARQALAGAVERITTHPATGEFGVFNSVGSIAWLVAVAAAIVALHGSGAGRRSLVLLGVATFMVMHIPPIGPTALVCLSAAGWRLERRAGVAQRSRRTNEIPARPSTRTTQRPAQAR